MQNKRGNLSKREFLFFLYFHSLLNNDYIKIKILFYIYMIFIFIYMIRKGVCLQLSVNYLNNLRKKINV